MIKPDEINGPTQFEELAKMAGSKLAFDDSKKLYLDKKLRG